MPGPAVLSRAGVQVVVEVDGPHLPRIVHWGADLGTSDLDLLLAGYRPPNAATHDADVPLTVLPSRAQGWAGRPGLTGHRDGAASQSLFELVSATVSNQADGDVLR